ncbi:hypothetical protein [Pseudomonas marincola]|uniref:hypothetical protein n=1 Tax=Pseudomonas marincola TaxID=437900 RepID=UPI0015621C2F|nr:hypothetical protein [Pseudomonas marincola]
MRPTTVETLQGELLALRCHIAALIELMPLSAQLHLPARLERNIELLRPCQRTDAQDGFDRAVSSLAVKRLSVQVRATENQGAIRGA